MACVVKEYHRYYGGVIGEYYFKSQKNAYNKFADIIKEAIKDDGCDFEDLLEDYDNSVEDFIDDCFAGGELEGIVMWDIIKFEDEED